jgi:hypothetical protein
MCSLAKHLILGQEFLVDRSCCYACPLTVTGLIFNDRRGVGCRRSGGAESGYPVTSASLPWSGPGGGAPGGAPHALNDLEPPAPGLLRPRRRRDGIPAPW